jgi:hypothetical protein
MNLEVGVLLFKNNSSVRLWESRSTPTLAIFDNFIILK